MNSDSLHIGCDAGLSGVSLRDNGVRHWIVITNSQPAQWKIANFNQPTISKRHS